MPAFRQAQHGPRTFLLLLAQPLPVPLLSLAQWLALVPKALLLVLVLTMYIVFNLTSSLPCKMNSISTLVNSFACSTSMMTAGLSAFVWTVRSKVLFPAHVSPSTQSSLVMARLVKALHKATCAALLSAHRWVPVVLSPVLSLQPVV